MVRDAARHRGYQAALAGCCLSDPGRSQAQSLGKGLVQINLRLSRIVEMLESTPRASGSDAALEGLFDLLEAVDRTVDGSTLPARVQWWRFWSPPAADLTGLRLVRDAVVEQLRAQGIEKIGTSGPQDPQLHKIIEVVPARDPDQHGVICRTARPGWHRAGTAIRLAHVITYRLERP